MKFPARPAAFVLALLAAGLGSGCASSTPSASYRQPAQDFEVVESSTDRPLTDTEKAEVRSSVASYLDREGVSDSGDYFLKVYLTPENVDAESEWVVVRFTRYTAQRVAVVSPYPYDSLMYSSYYPYYAYDVYPFGYGSVSRISFQYYVDPYYGKRHYYYPRHGHGGHKGGHHDTAHNNHGGNLPHVGHDNGPEKKPGPHRAPPGSRYTGYRSNVPVDADARRRPDRPNRNYPAPSLPVTPDPAPASSAPVVQQDPSRPADAGQRRENSRNHWRGRPGVDGAASDVATTNRGDGRGRPDRASNPNLRSRGNGPTGSTTASTQSPGVRPPTQWRNNRVNSGQAPSGVNNPPRTRAYVPPTGNGPAPVASRPAPSQRPANPVANRPVQNHSRPAPTVQQNRTPAPAHQQPARLAPSAASRGESRDSPRSNGNGQREALR